MTESEIRPPRREDIPALTGLWQEAFPEDTAEEIGDFFALGFAPERSLALYGENRPLSMLYWFDGVWGGGRLAYLYAVATQKTARGRGHSSRLIEAACEILTKRGYAGALLVPAEPELFLFYGKLGFVPCCPGVKMTISDAGGLAPLTPPEYEVFRKPFLGSGDAVLTGAALDYFGGDGEFYEGPEGVLALARVPEAGAPAAEGFGRIVTSTQTGGDTAMFRPLKPGVPAPERFTMTLA